MFNRSTVYRSRQEEKAGSVRYSAAGILNPSIQGPHGRLRRPSGVGEAHGRVGPTRT